jgi:hypothetical protein
MFEKCDSWNGGKAKENEREQNVSDRNLLKGQRTTTEKK